MILKLLLAKTLGNGGGGLRPWTKPISASILAHQSWAAKTARSRHNLCVTGQTAVEFQQEPRIHLLVLILEGDQLGLHAPLLDDTLDDFILSAFIERQPR